MSATNQPEDLDEPSKYAPKWIREEQAKQRTAEVRRLPTAPQLVVSDEDMKSAASRWQNDAPFEGDLAIKRMRIQRSLEPERLSEPEWTKPSGFPFGMLVRASVAIGVAILGALAYVGELQLPFMRAPQETAARETIGSDLRYPVPAETSRPAKMAGRVSDPRAAAPAAVPDPAPVRAEAAPKAPEPADAPRTVKPVALAATTTAPWPTAPAQPAVPTAPVATAPAAPAAVAPITRRLEPEEINTLIQRGEAFISQGDISAARLMLKRAAEAGNPRAALALGATYDPDMLKKMGVLGFAPDIAQAREWYERAAALGSGEATRRLAALR